MAGTHMSISQDCGCLFQGTYDLENRDDADFLIRIQKRRCLTHRYPSPAPGRLEGDDDPDSLNYRGY